MGEVSQDNPEINSNQPNRLLRDCMTMRLAYEIANSDEWAEQIGYEDNTQAYINGLKIVEDLDSLAYDDGLLRRPVVMSGPSVTVPNLKIVSKSGETRITTESEMTDTLDGRIIRAYNEHPGEFYGFCVIIKEVDGKNGRRFIPQIAYLMQVGGMVHTPVISGRLSAYGLVKDTDIHFVEDEVMLSRKAYLNELGSRSRNMDYYVIAHTDLFKNCLDKPLTSDNLADMVSALEKIANYYSDDTALALLDTMTEMLKQYLSVSSGECYIRPTTSYSYDDSFDHNNGPAMRHIDRERLDEIEETFPLIVQEIVFLPKYDRLSSDGKWALSDEKIVYFVYNKDGKDVYVPANSSEVAIGTQD